jgi:hypothetical protein
MGTKPPIYSTILHTGLRLERLVGVFSTYFTQMISGFDPVSYYQSFLFVVDFGGLYAILLLESTRSFNWWTQAAG